MAQSHVVLYCHVVFTTRNRVPVLTGDVLERAHQYIAGIARNLKFRPIAVGGIADHVHVLLQLNPKLPVPDLVRGIKSNSARWIHETFPSLGEFAWQDGYGAFSISMTHVDKVATYIRHQEEHHRTNSVEMEMTRLFERQRG